MRKRPNWSRRLPRPFTIPGIMTLATLADVREFLRHLPADCRELSTWRHVADQLVEAVRGGDVTDVAAALLIVLALERAPCRPG